MEKSELDQRLYDAADPKFRFKKKVEKSEIDTELWELGEEESEASSSAVSFAATHHNALAESLAQQLNSDSWMDSSAWLCKSVINDGVNKRIGSFLRCNLILSQRFAVVKESADSLSLFLHSDTKTPILSNCLEKLWESCQRAVHNFVRLHVNILPKMRIDFSTVSSENLTQFTIILEDSRVDVRVGFENKRSAGIMYLPRRSADDFPSSYVSLFWAMGERRLGSMFNNGRSVATLMKRVAISEQMDIPSAAFDAIVMKYFERQKYADFPEKMWGLIFWQVWEGCWQLFSTAPEICLLDREHMYNIFDTFPASLVDKAQTMYKQYRAVVYEQSLHITIEKAVTNSSYEVLSASDAPLHKTCSMDEELQDDCCSGAPIETPALPPFNLLEWLTSFGFQEFYDAFVDYGLENAPVTIKNLSKEDMRKLGLTLLGQQIKFRKHAAQLKF